MASSGLSLVMLVCGGHRCYRTSKAPGGFMVPTLTPWFTSAAEWTLWCSSNRLDEAFNKDNAISRSTKGSESRRNKEGINLQARQLSHMTVVNVVCSKWQPCHCLHNCSQWSCPSGPLIPVLSEYWSRLMLVLLFGTTCIDVKFAQGFDTVWTGFNLSISVSYTAHYYLGCSEV